MKNPASLTQSYIIYVLIGSLSPPYPTIFDGTPPPGRDAILWHPNSEPSGAQAARVLLPRWTNGALEHSDDYGNTKENHHHTQCFIMIFLHVLGDTHFWTPDLSTTKADMKSWSPHFKQGTKPYKNWCI